MAMDAQFVTIFYFDDLSDGEQLRGWERMMERFRQNWGHMLNEHGMWRGRELGKRERLWWVGFWKDEHASDAVHTDPTYKPFLQDFVKQAGPVKMRMENVTTTGSIPLHEALAAGITLLGYIRCPDRQHAAKVDEHCERCIEGFDYTGWHGLAYVPAVKRNETVIFGAWDSVEASQQVGADGRFLDLLSEVDEAYDSADETFLTHVKFKKY